jgi:hypothetical protein
MSPEKSLFVVSFAIPSIGHEYSYLVYLPNRAEDRELHWVGLLAYNMLYHARFLASAVRYPWEKKKVQVLSSMERPSQVQRDYRRIIREIGTPAPIPKPRGKSPGRQLGNKIGERSDRPIIRKSTVVEEAESGNQTGEKKRASPKKRRAKPRMKYLRIRRIWSKNRSPPMRC